MSTATHTDIRSMIPGIEDHAAVELLNMQPTVAELEAALALMTSDGDDLIEFEHDDGSRLHGLLEILNRAGCNALPDPDA